MCNRNYHRVAGMRLALAALVFASVLSGIAQAANIRGRLVRMTPRGSKPAQGIPVSVFRKDLGRSAFAYSGNDGMYYLSNLPDGDYILEVWVYPGQPPRKYRVRAEGENRFSDVQPIEVP